MLESYYLETKDGLFFAVKGSVHPPDRCIGVLRYAPDAQKGERTKDGISYRRLYRFAEQEEYLKETYPQYLVYDPVFQTTLQSVPGSLVRRVYDPRVRLLELRQTSVVSAIEEDAVALAGLLQREAGVPGSALGISGSLLIGLHTDLSDLDMVVFGTQNCKQVYRALYRLLDAPSDTGLRRLDARGVEELYAQRTVDSHMAFEDFVSLEKRKVNQGCFRERTYFIRFIKEVSEAGEVYGQLHYTPLGRMTATATIADDSDSIFTPCRYFLYDVCSLENLPLPDLTEIVSFRGRFCEQARTGERIAASGTLEIVRDNRRNSHRRLLLGNSPEDMMVIRR
jgi:predicted nucleotidyltransferase